MLLSGYPSTYFPGCVKQSDVVVVVVVPKKSEYVTVSPLTAQLRTGLKEKA